MKKVNMSPSTFTHETDAGRTTPSAANGRFLALKGMKLSGINYCYLVVHTVMFMPRRLSQFLFQKQEKGWRGAFGVAGG